MGPGPREARLPLGEVEAGPLALEARLLLGVVGGGVELGSLPLEAPVFVPREVEASLGAVELGLTRRRACQEGRGLVGRRVLKLRLWNRGGLGLRARVIVRRWLGTEGHGFMVSDGGSRGNAAGGERGSRSLLGPL